MKKIKILVAFFVAMSLANCEDKDYDSAVEPGDVPLTVGFARATYLYKIDPANPVYKLAVTSTQVSNVDRVITIEVDNITTDNDPATTALPGDYTFSNTVVIPAGSYVGYGDITFDFDAAPAGDPRVLSLNLITPDDGTFRNDTKDDIILSYKQLCVYTEVQIKFTFDNWSEENRWELYNANSEVVAEGGPFAADLTNAVSDLCLEDGAYTFVIYDQYGDGMCCASGSGSYDILVDGVVVHHGNGQFTSFDIAEFTVGN